MHQLPEFVIIKDTKSKIGELNNNISLELRLLCLNLRRTSQVKWCYLTCVSMIMIINLGVDAKLNLPLLADLEYEKQNKQNRYWPSGFQWCDRTVLNALLIRESILKFKKKKVRT